MRGIRNSAGSRATVAVAMLAAIGLANAADNNSSERAAFGRVEGEITLDGQLNEADWRVASPITQFFEIYPANLGKPAVATSAVFLYDDRNVYVAIRALDSDVANIRAPIVRRDQVLDDQDYVEVFLDPMNTRRSALFFRVSARGILTDGQYDDKTRIRDYSPDLDFDAAASIDAQGWIVEMRVPLSSLRYQPGIDNRWAYVVYRNVPRQQVVTLASAPVPRGEECDLCYANVLDGIPAGKNRSLSVVPHLEYARTEDDLGTSDEASAGIDLTWKPRESTVVDATLFPDFSQIEADVPQLTANTLFALAVPEKRSFFLEGADLLTTPLQAIYTRAFTDPDAGVRITDRSPRHEYTALLLRDAGGGAVIEPGPINSRLALQDFESTALVARNRLLLGNTAVGMLATGRFNDDGSQNVLIGADGSWRPSPADQITVQFLNAQTRNPDRQDLLDVWQGQRLRGNAGSVGWTHSSNDWYANVSYASYSRDFRAWNGFVTQVGSSSFDAVADWYFYPDNDGVVTRLGPRLTVFRADGNAGGRISQWIAPGFTIRAAGDTTVSFTWYPRADVSTLAGLRSYELFAVSIASTPFAWMPQAKLSIVGGETLDVVTGAVGDGRNIQATVPLRFSQLEITSTVGYQSSRMASADGVKRTQFSERNMQVSATWHFSSKLNLRLTYQEATLDAIPPFAGLDTRARNSDRASSLLLSYQTNWQTRYYVGARQTPDQNQIFAKISYAFSN